MANGSIGTAYVNIVPKADGMKNQVSAMMTDATGPAGTKAGSLFGLKMKAALAVGAAAAGAALVAGVSKAITEGGKLEQSIGGIETMFKSSSDVVIKNARQAYKTAGISANEYMENVTSFSAGLIKSLGGDTKKAAKIADTAILDMSDNANKMGTDITSIQTAYQGFAKQNYTMLDNLKLGYGGTKQEMERLLEDAGKLSGQKYDISNLSDVYEAIHVIQGELGITGTTAKEASQTLSGSFNSMKAAFTDLMGNLAMGENVSESMQALVQSIVTFVGGNLIPAIGRIFMSLPEAISGGMKAVSSLIPENFLTILGQALDNITLFLPFYLQRGVELVTSIGQGIISKIPDVLSNMATLITMLTTFIANNYPKIVSAGIRLIGGLTKAFIQHLPQILTALGKVVLAVGKGLLKLIPVGLNAGLQLLKAIGSGIGSAVGALVGKVKSVIDKILAPIKGLVQKVKGFFPLSIGKIFSNIKLPHFSVSGGKAPWGLGGAGSPPKFNVEWFAKGAILTEATLFGAGEKGDEAVLPLDPLWKRLDNIAESSNSANININVYGAEGQSPAAVAQEVKRILIRETKQRRLAW